MEVETWSEYRKYLLMTLERLERDIKAVDGKIDALRAQVAHLEMEFSMQKVRIGLLGAAAGSIPSLAAAIIWLVMR